MEKFISNFAEQFDDTDISSIKPETEFHNLEEWSSMLALGIIGMVDVEYGVEISGNDLQSCKTIQDVFDLVQSKK